MTIDKYINRQKVEAAFKAFHDAQPYPFCVIDDFFKPNVAQALAREFPEFEDPAWHQYNNPIEIKKTCNNWNMFPKQTYFMFDYLNTREVRSWLSKLTGIAPLYADPGLNGGGWHIHRAGGKLNIHLDYSLHPKLGHQRKMNLIVYMNPDWQEDWGGELGIWEQDSERRKPGPLRHKIAPMFNRAVFFDTTQNSWHGLPDPVGCPEGQCRKSMAIYYLTDPAVGAEDRGKALFAPTQEQEDDPEILELIRKRSATDTAADVYG